MMMAVAIIKIITLRNIVIMVTMIDQNESYSNSYEIYDGKDDNGDSSDNDIRKRMLKLLDIYTWKVFML